MKNALKTTWFFIRMLIIAVLLLAVVLLSLPLLPISKRGFMGVIKGFDDVIASLFFFSFERTVSGIVGEGKVAKKTGFNLVANIIDKGAMLLGDEPDHCEYQFRVEQHLHKTLHRLSKIKRAYVLGRPVVIGARK